MYSKIIACLFVMNLYVFASSVEDSSINLLDEKQEEAAGYKASKDQLLKNFTPEKSEIILRLIRKKYLFRGILGLNEGECWEVGGGLNTHYTDDEPPNHL